MNRKAQGSSIHVLVWILVFWGVLIMFMSFFGKAIVVSDNDPYSQIASQDMNGFELLWNIMTFQVTGVPFWISIIINMIGLVSIAVSVYVIRGVS